MNSEAALGMFAGENLLEGGGHPLHQSGLLPQLALSPVVVVAQQQGQLGHTVEAVGLKEEGFISISNKKSPGFTDRRLEMLEDERSEDVP